MPTSTNIQKTQVKEPSCNGARGSVDESKRSFLKLGGAVGLLAVAGMAAQACEKAAEMTPSAMPRSGPSPQNMPDSQPVPAPETEMTPAMAAGETPLLRPTPSIMSGEQSFAQEPLAATVLTPRPLMLPVKERDRMSIGEAAPVPTIEPQPARQPASRAALSALAPAAAASGALTERMRIAHLLRRAGFGASQQELDRFEKMGLTATVDYLLNFEEVDNSALETRLQALNLDLSKAPDMQRWWLLRMIYTQRPLQEKMAFFWHGLLTSGFRRVGRLDHMLKQNELYRSNALGRYDDMLKAISRDPAMLIYLDSRSNRKAAPNENFARELMELFSLGVGNYTETDVREGARAFTGYFLNNEGFIFNLNQHDAGSKMFLRTQGYHKGDDVIDIIMKQPAALSFVCRKLYNFFASGDPEPRVLESLELAFWASSFSMKAVLRELFKSEAFYSERVYRFRIKSPVELVAGTFHTLGIKTEAAGLPALLTRMGQTIFDPPNVAGWPGGPAWINSTTMIDRVNFASSIVNNRSAFKPEETAEKSGAKSWKEAVDYYLNLLLDGNMAAEEREALYDYAGALAKVVDFDVSLRAVVYLILASADYQLA